MDQALPYKYGGKTKRGINSPTSPRLCVKQFTTKWLKCLQLETYSVCKPIPNPKGDFMFFKIESEKIWRVGVYLQNNKFIHASTKKGVIINDLNEAYYKKYFYKAARIK